MRKKILNHIRWSCSIGMIIGSIGMSPCVFGAPNPENGVQQEYFENGKLRLENIFKNGQIVRKRTFYRNGHLLFEERYKNGDLRLRRTFYEDGGLKSMWTKKSGVAKYYSDDGKLKSTVK